MNIKNFDSTTVKIIYDNLKHLVPEHSKDNYEYYSHALSDLIREHIDFDSKYYLNEAIENFYSSNKDIKNIIAEFNIETNDWSVFNYVDQLFEFVLIINKQLAKA